MPIPFVLIGVAAVTGAVGIGKNIQAGIRNKNAKEIIKEAQAIYNEAEARLDAQREITLGDLESFASIKIQIWSNDLGCYIEHFRRFKNIEMKGDVCVNERLNAQVQQLNIKEMAKTSLTAKEIAKGGVAVVGAGAMAGIATYGGAMLFGHASTGAAIAALHGVAAKNAALAFLGGGAKVAGGLGVAGGSAMLAGVVIGPVLAVQGLITAAKAKERLAKAQEAYSEAVVAAEKMDTMILMLQKISEISGDYSEFLQEFVIEYRKVINGVIDIYNRAVNEQKKTLGNAIKNFFGIKFKLDFNKLSLTDQKYLQFSWLMTQVLYHILSSSLMTQEGDIHVNAESSLEDAKVAASTLLQGA